MLFAVSVAIPVVLLVVGRRSGWCRTTCGQPTMHAQMATNRCKRDQKCPAQTHSCLRKHSHSANKVCCATPPRLFAKTLSFPSLFLSPQPTHPSPVCQDVHVATICPGRPPQCSSHIRAGHVIPKNICSALWLEKRGSNQNQKLILVQMRDPVLLCGWEEPISKASEPSSGDAYEPLLPAMAACTMLRRRPYKDRREGGGRGARRSSILHRRCGEALAAAAAWLSNG